KKIAAMSNTWSQLALLLKSQLALFKWGKSCHNGEEEQVEILVTEGSGKHHVVESRSKRSRHAE
ncbi:hypothetical protein Tco_1241024, partial [Tanacetum coccineum]